MKGNVTYYSLFKKYRKPLAFLRIVVCLVLCSLLVTHTCLGRDEPVYDEISVYINVPGLGSMEVPAVIENEKLYLAISSVFDFLKIKNTLSPKMDSVYGYFISPQNPYLIDKTRDLIILGDKAFYPQPEDMILTESNLYLKAEFFGMVFGLNCTFSFRSLSVILNTNVELPVIREMRQEAMRNNLNRLKGEMKADTTIGRNYPLFHFGMADWSAISAQDNSGVSDLRLNLALGAIVFGGETNVALNYNKGYPFQERGQYYLWRLVNNKSHILRQVMAGKIYTQATSSIFNPVVGVQFTNTPTTYRRSFGTYVLSDHTEPNWIVELYVNGVLVNYVKADASGFFTFEVPMVYGNSIVKLRYYGPFGEERYSEQNINIPFNFIPLHQLEYSVSAGVVEDTSRSKIGRAAVNYGLAKRLTIGGGWEYLSSVSSGKNMPFVNFSARLASNLLISGEYMYGVRMKDVLSYRLPSNLQFELTYSKYTKGQTAINNNFLEERRAVVSYPFRSSSFSLFSRFSFYQIVLPTTKYTTVDALFSGVVHGISANLTTYVLFTSDEDAYVYSNLSSTFRLPKKLIFTPQVQYEYNQHKIINARAEVGKYLSARGYANVYYENNFKSNIQNIGLSFRYDISFAQLSFSSRYGDHMVTTTESARGSLMYNKATDFFSVNNRTNVGKGGIAVIPFLDLNSNGKRDKNEPKAFGLTLQINGGRVKYSKSDTTIIVSDLEAYNSYIVRFSSDAFENVAWQLLKKTYNITIDANQLKVIEVPVTIIGEVSGTIFIEENKGRKPLGRILINFYKNDSTLVGHTLSESDGFFSFSALTKGAYIARIDSAQLNKLHMVCLPVSIPFTISGNKEGDVLDDMEFVLKRLAEAVPVLPGERK